MMTSTTKADGVGDGEVDDEVGYGCPRFGRASSWPNSFLVCRSNDDDEWRGTLGVWSLRLGRPFTAHVQE